MERKIGKNNEGRRKERERCRIRQVKWKRISNLGECFTDV